MSEERLLEWLRQEHRHSSFARSTCGKVTIDESALLRLLIAHDTACGKAAMYLNSHGNLEQRLLGAEKPTPVKSVEEAAALWRAGNEPGRRSRIDKMIPGELAIREAIRVVEEAGCHPDLTKVVVMLGEAQSKLADWYDLGASGSSNHQS